ncbi:hypothetical protein ETB97_010351 [Aspergillus alliaceus]|uniref:Uncharacterized protein n=1 Tax=Petromyces alliaceus TaxID=209559 RepID=A0A8H5ZQH4_PETAA|nr:hypothetical protein ETB97_010351 [Aspergillus burnettii]
MPKQKPSASKPRPITMSVASGSTLQSPFHISYVISIPPGKVPDEIREDRGIGNADFSAGQKVSNYAYQMLDLWRLTQPIGLKLAISKRLLKGPPQK